jgi:hypothetical protein
MKAKTPRPRAGKARRPGAGAEGELAVRGALAAAGAGLPRPLPVRPPRCRAHALLEGDEDPPPPPQESPMDAHGGEGLLHPQPGFLLVGFDPSWGLLMY